MRFHQFTLTKILRSDGIRLVPWLCVGDLAWINSSSSVLMALRCAYYNLIYPTVVFMFLVLCWKNSVNYAKLFHYSDTLMKYIIQRFQNYLFSGMLFFQIWQRLVLFCELKKNFSDVEIISLYENVQHKQKSSSAPKKECINFFFASHSIPYFFNTIFLRNFNMSSSSLKKHTHWLRKAEYWWNIYLYRKK